MPYYQKYVLAGLIALIVINEIRENRLAGLRNCLSLRLLKRFLALLGLLLLALAAMTPFDPAVLAWVRGHGGDQSLVATAGAQAAKYSWKILILGYVVCFVFKLRGWKNSFFNALLANGLAALLCTGFKFSILRARPDNNLGPFSFFNWKGLTGDQTRFQSFPSGDVAVVAGACAYFFFAVKNKFLRLLLVLIPLATAFARINANRHWPTDTLCSIGLGFLAAYWVASHQTSIFSGSRR